MLKRLIQEATHCKCFQGATIGDSCGENNTPIAQTSSELTLQAELKRNTSSNKVKLPLENPFIVLRQSLI